MKNNNDIAPEISDPCSSIFSRRCFHHPAVQMGLILVIGLGLYLHTMDVPFIFDDYVCVKDNPAVANFSYFTDYSTVRALDISSDIKNNFELRPVTYQTQAVTYIGQRFTSLATFFYLFALLLYIRARTAPPLGQLMGQ